MRDVLAVVLAVVVVISSMCLLDEACHVEVEKQRRMAVLR